MKKFLKYLFVVGILVANLSCLAANQANSKVVVVQEGHPQFEKINQFFAGTELQEMTRSALVHPSSFTWYSPALLGNQLDLEFIGFEPHYTLIRDGSKDKSYVGECICKLRIKGKPDQQMVLMMIFDLATQKGILVPLYFGEDLPSFTLFKDIMKTAAPLYSSLGIESLFQVQIKPLKATNTSKKMEWTIYSQSKSKKIYVTLTPDGAGGTSFAVE